MSFVLPPNGTRGSEIPKPLRGVMKVMSGMGNLMFRLGAKVQGRPLLKLTTVGARSGKKRQTILGWFDDDNRSDSWVVVASAAGSAHHPGWAYNLVRYPADANVEVAGRAVPVSAELITGPERSRIWEQIVTIAPGYGVYTKKTDREIPLFRLSPLTSETQA